MAGGMMVNCQPAGRQPDLPATAVIQQGNQGATSGTTRALAWDAGVFRNLSKRSGITVIISFLLGFFYGMEISNTPSLKISNISIDKDYNQNLCLYCVARPLQQKTLIYYEFISIIIKQISFY